ncbi:MAG: NAD(P)-dependent oxidoreductase [Anaerolineales bacterium]|nr:NAD(P)-dependent oxidoreductase [Anaerolineales bacterium]
MITQDLAKLEAEGNPIRLGVSAMGWMGSGFLTAVAHVAGMKIPVLANEDPAEARDAFINVGVPVDDIVEADALGPAMDVLRSGKRVITPDYSLPAQLEDVDIVVDVTWSPAIGAETAYSAIQNGKDVVLVNIEADVTVGRILSRLARDAGVLYTVSSGDEPGCLMELYNFVTCLGYDVIVIGKGKNNPLNPAATPETVAESARKADKDPFQVASYVDGTKTMFEMTCAANATGCRPMKRGMTGPEATLENVSEIFALEEDGGITRSPMTVDFVQGTSMAGGVFTTVRIEDERIQTDLEYLKVGKGKYFTFFRPYHLWFLEAPISIARAYLYREPTLVPLDVPVAEAMTIAKRDLKPDEILDEFGGFTFYGLMDRVEEARNENALPVGLAPGARIVRSVAADEIITWDHVELDETSTVVRLRRQQDAL